MMDYASIYSQQVATISNKKYILKFITCKMRSGGAPVLTHKDLSLLVTYWCMDLTGRKTFFSPTTNAQPDSQSNLTTVTNVFVLFFDVKNKRHSFKIYTFVVHIG